MSKLGAGARLATVSTVGAGLGGLIGIWGSNKVRALSALGGATVLGGAAALDHKMSPYSPVGKKNWKPMPIKHPMRKLLFMNMNKIDNTK